MGSTAITTATTSTHGAALVRGTHLMRIRGYSRRKAIRSADFEAGGHIWALSCGFDDKQLVSVSDCTMEHVNRKDDPFNTVVSWAGAHALASVRQGPRAAALSGLKGAAVGGLAEIAAYGLDI